MLVLFYLKSTFHFGVKNDIIFLQVYHQGWANGGGIKNDPSHSQYGYHLPLRHIGSQQFGVPLFWSQYSFLGLDPRGLVDKYADYGGHNTNHTLINRYF